MATYVPPLPTEKCKPEQHAKEGGCYHCCERCNYDRHYCFFCGDPLRHDDKTLDGETNPCYTEEVNTR